MTNRCVRQIGLRCLLPALVTACSPNSGLETAVGTLEMVEVNVGPLQVARAVRVLVQEGDPVRAGDTLAVFSTPTLTASVAQAEARAAATDAAAQELANGPRPAEIARADQELAVADADATRAAADLARLEPLAAQGDVSRATLDAARAAARSTASRRDAAREALRLVRDGARVERRRAAAAEARGAQAAVDAWKATASDLVLVSPVDGVISSRNVEPGEVLAAGQSALTVGQPSRPWARIYVSQFVLPRLKAGDTLSARLDGDTTTFRGRITAIATRAEFTPRVALTEQEREDLLFGVKVEFAEAGDRLRAGMPITVTLPPAQ
ncbi:MAG: HlyD family secretion protein [Gemmatimonas sp.]|uniref:HlyD family secretion protein n=1 Tax=Gemmatimonas sp. TaxID=1962908 RepID=UPI0025BA079D|nr:HlyD family efflux transporter periplasmic adaptor subunit [Gemmatimonas sp.]MCE2954243.1 HlyD family efflux transporter periplasmic adaptor subunit [Gemmatimonas sp.]